MTVNLKYVTQTSEAAYYHTKETLILIEESGNRIVDDYQIVFGNKSINFKVMNNK